MAGLGPAIHVLHLVHPPSNVLQGEVVDPRATPGDDVLTWFTLHAAGMACVCQSFSAAFTAGMAGLPSRVVTPASQGSHTVGLAFSHLSAALAGSMPSSRM